PCLRAVFANSGSFVDPVVNAQQAAAAVAQLDRQVGGNLPLHFLGYSQGSFNALMTLATYPELAARTRSVVTLNSAARGTPVGDTLYKVAQAISQNGNPCANAPDVLKPTCEWALRQAPAPSEPILRLIAKAMGVPVEQLAAFMRSEDSISPAPT